MEEAQHITNCDGCSVKSVREWIRGIRAAAKRVPDQSTVNSYMKKLISRTSCGDLFEEVEVALNKDDRDLAVWTEVIDHILDAFLGPDEQDTLRDELKKMKQGAREDIPAFNRRFLKAAEVAYPRMTDAEEATITTSYMVALRPGKIQDRLFDHEPRLISLRAATLGAYKEWARTRFRERVLQRRPEPEPMEVDSLTVREQLANQEKEIKALKKKLQNQTPAAEASPRTPSPSNSSTSGPGKQSTPPDRCLYCGEKGHWKRSCPKNKAYWERKGGPRRPLPPNERSLKN